jgi:hypothetical protein
VVANLVDFENVRDWRRGAHAAPGSNSLESVGRTSDRLHRSAGISVTDGRGFMGGYQAIMTNGRGADGRPDLRKDGLAIGW